MSNYRQIHTRIWKDNWFLELEPTHKLFFIYLFSNEQASLAGIYEMSIRVMSFESGLTVPEIKDAFKIFAEAGKARYMDGVVWVPNLRKYHETQSPKVQTRILKDLDAVKDCELKGIYCDLYGIDRVSVGDNRVSIPPSTITTTVTSKKEPQKKEKPPEIEIPSRLDTPEFIQAWQNFTEHRKEIKAKMTPRAANMQLKKLAEYQPDVAVSMLEQSVMNGWKSVYELKQPSSNGSKPQQADQLLAIIGKYGRNRWQLAEPDLKGAGLLDAVRHMGGWSHVCGMRETEIKFAFYEAVKR